MADTGEDRELKQRVNGHQAQVVKHAKQLAQKTKAGARKTEKKDPQRSSRSGDECHQINGEERSAREAALDETIAESFPARDPPSTDPNPEAA